jgi:trans-aconitate 2-methyltransferase
MNTAQSAGMDADKEKVAKYYDKFWEEHELKNISKPNSRHRTIFKNLKKEGLKPSSSVLEIGCGIGSLSRMLIKYLSEGFFAGTDIAPQTIELLKKAYPDRSKCDFVSTDMLNFSYPKKFDFIVFPDVLEHIPVEAHPNIFQSLIGLMHDNTVILINNPYPLSQEHVIEHRKDLLQIIDLPLQVDHFARLAYGNGLYIEKVEPYALWTRHFDYQNIVMKPKKALKAFEQKSKIGLMLANIKSRF